MEFPKTVDCKWCGRTLDNNPGSYYHQKDCEARFLRDCITRETDPVEIKKLQKRIERASYTGD